MAQEIGLMESVLKRLAAHGLQLKRGKCEFFQHKVDYLGYCVDKEGLHTMPNKVGAIIGAPVPKNVHELRAFLGMTNYYGKFTPCLLTLAQPLNQLLRKWVPWNWSSKCQQAVEGLKQKLASAEVLAHYDVSLHLKLDCDALAYGVGAILAHVYPDRSERPIVYASRMLTPAECNYAQIWPCTHFWGKEIPNKYVYGCKFTLVTDHKPLQAILGSKKNLPSLAAACLQR